MIVSTRSAQVQAAMMASATSPWWRAPSWPAWAGRSGTRPPA